MNDIINGKCKIHVSVLGSVNTNCYIVSNQSTKEAIVIDPADRADVIEAYIKEEGLTLKGILLTHGHFDHILAAVELGGHLHAKIYANENEKELLADSNLNFGANVGIQYGLEADVLLKDGQKLEMAGFLIKAIHTPGHTGGGTCYYFEDEKELFAGDTLFRESIGRTDLPTGNMSTLLASISEKLMNLEDGINVYPGHGSFTTIGYERKNNPYLN